MIPSTLATITEAAAALAEYRAADPVSRARAEFRGGLKGHPFPAAGKTLEASRAFSRLDRLPGPGPVVTVAQNGSQRLLGRSDADRGSYLVALPQITPYGLAQGPETPFPAANDYPVDVLDGLVIDHGLVLALAARLDTCARIDQEARRHRQAEGHTEEASHLIELGREIQGLVPIVGPAFLDHWRAQAARWTPDPPKGPAYRSAALRSTR